MSFAIQLLDVTKKFKDFVAVDKLNLEVKTGEVYGFLGPNGSGKSTTLRMIMDLIKPTSGEIKLFDKSLKKDRSDIMRKIGCMIERPDFYTYLTAHENLKLFARAHQLYFSYDEYKKLYKIVGLEGRENGKVKTYSHGMKQRLGIAHVLLHNPELIILDEPNTGLDPQGIIDLRMLINKLNQERNMTILFSSHILSEVQEVSNSMIVIHNGKTIVQGKVKELLSHESLFVKLEVTQTENCKTYLKTSNWKTQYQSTIETHEQTISLSMSKNEIPKLIKDLSANNFDILRIDYKNQLEEYFLRITNS